MTKRKQLAQLTVNSDIITAIDAIRISINAGENGDGIKVTIGKNVKNIPAYLFYTSYSSYSPNITSVVFEQDSECEIIGTSAFRGCSRLRNIITPNNVIYIGDYAFRVCSGLTSVTIPDSVTSIGSDAFYYCTSLTSVYYNGTIDQWVQIHFNNWSSNPLCYAKNLYIDNTIVTEANITTATKINDYAFDGCTSIISVTIGKSVTSIGSYAFIGCDKLVEVINKSSLNIKKGSSDNGSVAHYALNVKNKGTTDIINVNDYLFLTVDNVNYLLGYVGSDTSLVLPESYNGQKYKIAQYAFYKCSNLTSITIPDNVTSIEYYAFYDCKSLETVTIGNGVTLIGNVAFYNCRNLTNITIGESVTSIGRDVFYNTEYYSDENNWENEVLYIGNYLIKAKTSIFGSYSIKENTILIAQHAFYYCKSLTSITIPDSVTTIGDGAFYNCTALTEINYNAINCADLSKNDFVFSYAGQNGDGIKVTIGKNVKNIPAYLFYSPNSSYSPKITSVVFEQGSVCESIGSCAFSDCTSLTSITIPDSVTSIESSAFYGCSSLTSITIPENVKSIGDYAFYYCESLTSITISDSVTRIGDYAFYGCSSLTSITIPDSVTSIGWSAFRDCSKLTSITIGNGITSIGNHAFVYCNNIKDVYVTDMVAWCNIDFNGYYANPLWHGSDLYLNNVKVTKLVILSGAPIVSDYAFYGCTSITSVTLPDSVNYIGDYAFTNCVNLVNVSFTDNVTSIGAYSFSGCTKLNSITLPNTIGSIVKGAFNNCNALSKVYFIGTADEWQNVGIGSNNGAISDATVYYYAAEQPSDTDGKYWHYDESGNAVEW